jgi:hypothetical protein
MLDDLVVPDSGGLALVLYPYDRFFTRQGRLCSDRGRLGLVLVAGANLSRRHHANLRMALWLTRRFNIVLVGTSHCLSRNHNARI